MTDPLLGSQWYLANPTWPDVTIGVLGVWPDYTGRGVRIGVVDDGIDYTHPDLAPNYDFDRDYDAIDRDGDAFPGRSYHNHGTLIAGVIGAAADNGIGIAGVAHGADLIAFRKGWEAELTPAQLADVLARQVDADVSNNSWTYGYQGFFDGFRDPALHAAAGALGNAVVNGRGGLGTVFVVPAGNDRADGQNTSYHAFQSSPWTIAVGGIGPDGSIAPFSTPGASVLVSAGAVGVLTTDRVGAAGYADGDYISTIQGTSLAAPQVSGVVALMLEANPDLGFRDVQEILARSARNPVESTAGWQINGAADWNGGGLAVSHDYGFGLVDARAAVRLAESWGGPHAYANMTRLSASAAPGLDIPDGASVASTVTVAAPGAEIDRAMIDLNIEHDRIGDLTVTLTSPGGTTSLLVDRPGRTAADPDGADQDDIHAQMSSVQFLGESGAGVWTLTVGDARAGNSGRLIDWTLTLFGDRPSSDDVYVYTAEWARHAQEPGRALLADADGTDTLNFAAMPADLGIDLGPGSESRLLGQPFRIAPDTVIENAIGGDGDDLFVGNAVANRLDGGRGNDGLRGEDGDDVLIGGPDADRLDGGAGMDAADYGAAGGAVFVRLWAGDGQWGEAQGDRLAGIETLVGSRFDDALAGDAGANRIDGDAGRDVVNGHGGDDILAGGAGADSIDGGDGVDTADYGQAAGPAFVRLWAGDGQWGEAQGDRLVRIENLTGTRFDDAFGGDAGANRIEGGAGADLINGHDGDDVLTGGPGADRIDGGAGVDLVDYGGSPVGVFARLWAGDGRYGDAEGDRLSGLEDLSGSPFDDVLSGSTAGNVIRGRGGDDALYGGAGGDRLVGGAGADWMEGGAGTDAADYGAAGGAVFVRLWAGDGQWGDAAGDRMTGIENLTGTRFDDVLAGNADGNRLQGAAGRDVLAGHGGADRLEGGAGDDMLTGGAGADLFVFEAGCGRDIIADFAAGDAIDLSLRPGLDSFDGLRAVAVQIGADIAIELGEGDMLTLRNVRLDSLAADDFLF